MSQFKWLRLSNSSGLLIVLGLFFIITIGITNLALDISSVYGQEEVAGSEVRDLQERPNIVIIITDDQPAMDGRLVNAMPNAKSIFVDNGVTFSDFHSESPLCCPSRVNFLTGQHTHNHGQLTNAGNTFNNFLTLTTKLDALDYHTFHIGKYLNNYGKCRSTGTGPCAPKVPSGWDRWVAFKKTGFFNYGFLEANNNPIAALVNYGSSAEDYSTDVIARKAVQFIHEAPTNQPIFAWIAPFSIHVPNTPAPRHATAACNILKWRPPSYNEADVTDKPLYVQQTPLLNSNSGYDLKKDCRGLLAVDDLVGDIYDALEATGRLDNTILIYVGDNGMVSGEHRLKGKTVPYVTEIPAYMYWRDLASTPFTIRERVQNIDLAPTLCEIAGCTMENANGISFLSLLENPTSTLGRDAVLDEMPANEGYSNNAIPNWYAVTTTSSSPLANEGCSLAGSGGCRWHYIHYPTTNERELYDISNGPCWTWSVGQTGDPCRIQNQIGNPAYTTIVSALEIRLAQLRAE